MRLAHLISALGWIGVDVVFGFLAVTGFTSSDPGRIATSYLALDAFAVPLLLAFGVATLGSGLVLSVGSGWGLLRYWWVVAKLLINIVLGILVLVLLAPRLSLAGAEAGRIDDTLVGRLGDVPVDLLFPAFVSGTALVIASLLGTFKPWGRISWRLPSAATSGRSRG